MRIFNTRPIKFLLFLGAVICDAHILLESKQITYTIAGMPTGNQSTWPARYKPTFETYLNSVVGTKFSPPIRFVLQIVDIISIFSTVEKGLADFVYPTSSIFSCLDSEYGLMPLVGIRRSYALNNRKYILNRYGGLMIVRANNTEIRDVRDLIGKVIVSINILNSQFQWKVFSDNGMNFLQDSAQIKFLPNNADALQVIWDVLNGNADVGFVRDITLNAQELKPRLAELKVLNLDANLLTDDGQRWPFQVSASPCFRTVTHSAAA